MMEQEMLDRIRRSADQVATPESLSPEMILEKCRNVAQESEGERKPANKKGEKKMFGIKNPWCNAGLAAAILLLCFISLKGIGNQASSVAPEMAAGQAADAGATETAPESAPRAERKNAGDLYTLAKGYEDVYETLDQVKDSWKFATNDVGMFTFDGAANEGMEMAVAESAVADTAAQKKMDAVDAAGGYSETNVQTLGIDESDIVKTDGEYIYLLRGSLISIVRAGNEKMELVSELEADETSAAAEVCAMYVDGDRLVVLTQVSATYLKKTGSMEDTLYDMDFIDTDMVTSALVYDISRKESPILLGKMTQDGTYVTSRKKGDMLYLFTSRYMMKDYGRDQEAAIPEVNARKIPADCIYIGDPGERALVISSVSVDRPETVRDSVMILDNGSEIYMGEDSLYLYRRNYKGNYWSSTNVDTEIAKFSMTDGYLNGEAAASVRGVVRDTFAIHEKAGKLRVLTTAADASTGDDENCLFLLDEKLKVTGKLTRIAVGERIYAARFLGDMAYFITYRNTDPLFAADLSDEKNPKIVGELKITGFSEYLHFWGEDKLLGIGYEIDPDSQEQKGLKLVMFDMSDPSALKTLGVKVLEKANYSPALFDYKAVLASPGENLIGFVTEYYERDRGLRRAYELFQWNGSGFERILAEDLNGNFGNESYRGLYIGEKFYIACPDAVLYYGRADYKLRQKLELGF